MATTTDGLPYPLNSDAANAIGTYIQNLAQAVDDLYVPDLLANRPSASKPGRRFYATDTGDTFLDTGSAWRTIACSARCAITSAGSSLSVSSIGGPRTLPLGSSITEAPVSGLFTRVTDGTGHAIQVAAGGLYRTSAVITATGGAAVVGGASLHGDDGLTVSTYSSVLRYSANDKIKVVGLATTGTDATVACASIFVERVGP